MNASDRALREGLALVVITDEACGEGRSVLDVARGALQGGAPCIQLRGKRMATRSLIDLGRQLKEETLRTGALLIVNDRMDVALLAGADGAHLGDDDLPLEAARSISPPGFILGRSVDDPAQASQAERAGADYVGVGPVYATPSKLDAAPAIGPAGISAVRAATRLPLVAIGGIDTSNAADIAAAGADGVAVIRAVMQAESPSEASRALLASLRSGLPRR